MRAQKKARSKAGFLQGVTRRSVRIAMRAY